jgi:hypothetical protein
MDNLWNYSTVTIIIKLMWFGLSHRDGNND